MPCVKWEGIYSALLTPFDTEDNLNLKLFEFNINAQVEAGIDTLVLGESLGKTSTLTNAEKNILLTHAEGIVKDKIPVILNIAEQSTQDVIKVAQTSENNGADGLMLLTPMRYKADKAETPQYFKHIAANTSVPIMIYNNPHDYKIEVTLDMFEELEYIQSIQVIKESTRDVSNVTRLKNRFNDQFKILCGVDTLAFEELTLGADGWVGGLMDVFLAETVAVYRLMKAGNYQRALEIYRWFFPLLELDIHPKFFSI